MMGFIDAITEYKRSGRNPVIPDIKLRSPEEGELISAGNVRCYASRLVSAGAPVLSVVTEGKSFGGGPDILKDVAEVTGVPVLRKDFLETEEEIIETKRMGASAVILKYSCLPPERLAKLYKAARSAGLDVLVETHSADELRLAKELGARLIGINNRDITRLETDGGDVSMTESLDSLAREILSGARNPIIISESSISSPEEVRRAVGAGMDGVLIGTALLKAADPGRYYDILSAPVGVKLCGMMDKEGIDICTSGASPEMLGVVTEYPSPVPWNLGAEDAERLIDYIPEDIYSCLVMGGDPGKIIALGESLRPDFIQIHNKESLEDTVLIARELAPAGIRIIRSVPTESKKTEAQFGTSDLEKISYILRDAGVARILMDSRNSENASGLGSRTPMEEFRHLTSVSPIISVIAGGINADNARSVISESGARYIDLMSGIEDAPGRKNPGLVKKLFDNICQAG